MILIFFMYMGVVVCKRAIYLYKGCDAAMTKIKDDLKNPIEA